MKVNIAGESDPRGFFLPQHTATLLCIDDELNVLTLRRKLLDNAGYKVRIALDGEAGLEIFRNEPVDLVVLDYKMPGMLGDEVAREMRRMRREIPLLLVTAFHDLPTTCTSVFDGVILKGESPSVLLSRIKDLIPDRLIRD